MTRAYFDHNATAPLHPAARDAMGDALGRVGNASSVHAEGRAARAVVEKARRAVADLVGGDRARVTFTSGGTEANATVLTPEWSLEGRLVDYPNLVVSAVEHPSVLAGGSFPADRVFVVPVDHDGVIRRDELDRRLTALDEPALVSVMMANNETGVVQPVAEVAKIAHEHGALVHTDAVQAVGRLPLDLPSLGVDVLTLSAHKLGGPQGAGAIIRAAGAPSFAPLIAGGGQEARLRAGTENVAAIAGFGAVAEVSAYDPDRIAAWCDMIAEIRAIVGNKVEIFGGEAARLPQTICLGMEGYSAETLVIALDLEGVAVSSGSACSSGKVGSSHVLEAMGAPEKLAKSAIRISLGWDTDRRSLDLFSNSWRNVLKHVSPE